VTLLGQSPGYEAAATKFGLDLVRGVDKTFLGLPLFNSMVYHANMSTASVAVIINGDVLLYDDFVTTILKVSRSFQNFMVVGARYDIDSLPTNLPEWDQLYPAMIRKHVHATGTLHTYGGMDFWAWNTSGPRLYDSVMPHFIFGRGKYDLWLTHEVISAGRRQVIDVSEACISVHVRHDYHLVSGATSLEPAGTGNLNTSRHHLPTLTAEMSDSKFWSENKKAKYELFVNIYLSLSRGSYSNHKGTVLCAPWKLVTCSEQSTMCLIQRRRPCACNCEASAYVERTQTDPFVRKGTRIVQCGSLSTDAVKDFQIPIAPARRRPRTFGLPITFDSLIDKIIVNDSVVVSAFTLKDSDLMHNWACNMRQLKVDNIVIAALDAELYKLAFTRGLPVFLLSEFSPRYSDGHVSEYISATQFVLLQLSVISRLIERGVDVMWLAQNVVWLKTPLSILSRSSCDVVVEPNRLPLKRNGPFDVIAVKASRATLRVFTDAASACAVTPFNILSCLHNVVYQVSTCITSRPPPPRGHRFAGALHYRRSLATVRDMRELTMRHFSPDLIIRVRFKIHFACLARLTLRSTVMRLTKVFILSCLSLSAVLD
jgi:Nucleotide-diphospho-sugar transferase